MRIKSITSKVKTISTHRTVKPVVRDRGGKWKRERDEVMRLDGGLCRQCRKEGRVTTAVEVDHIVPLFEGGADTVSNKQALCLRCHQAKSYIEEMRRRGRDVEL